MYDNKLVEAAAYAQTQVFEAAAPSPRPKKGPAPQSAHSVTRAVDEASKPAGSGVNASSSSA
ncbi:hypothetical protein ABZT03_41115 [Streptomyces sp. NPDC005574]|uniref:hypothetical protein n=1 Tax=Streptomyces sp. NPDC005574 TaxID=3156891 RepID=UPI0033A89C30